MIVAPAFRDCYISVVSTRLDTLRTYWARSSEDAERPLALQRAGGKPIAELGGTLCRVDADGAVSTNDMWMAAGMTWNGAALLVTSPWAVAEVSDDLRRRSDDIWDIPLLNAVHWVAPSKAGWLLACSGLDLIIEVDRSGVVVWQWWAIDHGMHTDPIGRHRTIDRDADHRGVDYGTMAQTTHVNSVLETSDGSILATLFHQGWLIRIDRTTGDYERVVDGLVHPHAVRPTPDGGVSFVDTGTGRVLIARSGHDGGFEVAITADTDWLQDGSYDGARQRWLLVDGRRSRILSYQADDYNTPDTEPAIWQLSDRWRPYSAIGARPGGTS